MSEQAKQSLVPELSVGDGKVVATSLHVAEVFEKRHADTLRAVDEILAQVDDSFGKRNFAFSEYTITNNLGFSVNKPMVLLTRDGFTLLAMGFTGKRALEFKIAYINAYNAMEQALIAQNNPPVLSSSQYADVRQWVDRIENNFHCKSGAQWAANAELRRRLGIPSVLKIPLARRAEAMAVLEELDKASGALRRVVVDYERLFFRNRFGEIPPDLIAAAQGFDSTTPAQLALR